MNKYSLAILFATTIFLRQVILQLRKALNLSPIKPQKALNLPFASCSIHGIKSIKNKTLKNLKKPLRLWANPSMTATYSLIGIEINDRSVHVVQSLNGSFQTVGYDFFCENPNIHDHAKTIKSVTESLIHVIKQEPFFGKKTVLSLPDSLMFKKTIPVPSDLNEEMIEVNVLLQSSHYFAVPVEEIYLDFQVIGRSLDKPGMVDVSFIACKAIHIKWRLQVAKKVGLVVVAVEPVSLALQRVRQIRRNKKVMPTTLSSNFLTAYGLSQKEDNLLCGNKHRFYSYKILS